MGWLILLAPGAGAPSTSPWMRALAGRLGALGRVVPFDYPYMREGRKRPDRLEALVEAHRAALASARRRHRGRVALVGKSMGSRIGCHLSLVEPVDALVCLGYPLVAAGSGKRRDAVLVSLSTRILFVQGTRDPLCPVEELEAVRARMRAPSTLHVVEGGDHSLQVLKRSGRPQAEVDAEIDAAIARFLG